MDFSGLGVGRGFYAEVQYAIDTSEEVLNHCCCLARFLKAAPLSLNKSMLGSDINEQWVTHLYPQSPSIQRDLKLP